MARSLYGRLTRRYRPQPTVRGEALTEIYPTFRENFVRGRFMDWPRRAEFWRGGGEANRGT